MRGGSESNTINPTFTKTSQLVTYSDPQSRTKHSTDHKLITEMSVGICLPSCKVTKQRRDSGRSLALPSGHNWNYIHKMTKHASHSFPTSFNKVGSNLLNSSKKKILIYFSEKGTIFSVLETMRSSPPIVHWTYKDKDLQTKTFIRHVLKSRFVEYISLDAMKYCFTGTPHLKASALIGSLRGDRPVYCLEK